MSFRIDGRLAILTAAGAPACRRSCNRTASQMGYYPHGAVATRAGAQPRTNRNKRSIVLDIKAPAARDVLL